MGTDNKPVEIALYTINDVSDIHYAEITEYMVQNLCHKDIEGELVYEDSKVIAVDTPNAKLIGGRTTEGSCVVYSTTTAGGSMFNISSRTELCCMDETGNYIQVDDGVQPDIELTNDSQYLYFDYFYNLIHQA